MFGVMGEGGSCIAHEGRASCRAAQENGDYAHAFWLCVQSGQAMGSLGTLRCAQPLAESVNALYEETIDRLESALQACCADFKPDTLSKVSLVEHSNSLSQIYLCRRLQRERVLKGPFQVPKYAITLYQTGLCISSWVSRLVYGAYPPSACKRSRARQRATQRCLTVL